mmetsp:Transcript_1390/g.3033  ORF Transcript_1390/g.3033 Transcript_1390/m.3033 type:complete len:338 (+) Transcript_1390:827-1840(+)
MLLLPRGNNVRNGHARMARLRLGPFSLHPGHVHLHQRTAASARYGGNDYWTPLRHERSVFAVNVMGWNHHGYPADILTVPRPEWTSCTVHRHADATNAATTAAGPYHACACASPTSAATSTSIESASTGPTDAVPVAGTAAAASDAAAAATATSYYPADAAADHDAPEAVNTYDQFGTKLAAVMRKLLQIRAEDPTGKVILFVQFDDLKLKVAAALRAFKLPVLTLQGTVAQRTNTIYDWQHNPSSSSFVLLLSLAQSASGTNLTAANHVVFLHPMLASSAAQASSFEKQAIGRARRHGQLRETVHVWRFVTLDTVEQQMSQQHQELLGADVLEESM